MAAPTAVGTRIYLVRVNDQGQIAEHWGVVDTIGTMGQLGLLPPQA